MKASSAKGTAHSSQCRLCILPLFSTQRNMHPDKPGRPAPEHTLNSPSSATLHTQKQHLSIRALEMRQTQVLCTSSKTGISSLLLTLAKHLHLTQTSPKPPSCCSRRTFRAPIPITKGEYEQATKHAEKLFMPWNQASLVTVLPGFVQQRCREQWAALHSTEASM